MNATNENRDSRSPIEALAAWLSADDRRMAAIHFSRRNHELGGDGYHVSMAVAGPTIIAEAADVSLDDAIRNACECADDVLKDAKAASKLGLVLPSNDEDAVIAEGEKGRE